MLAGVRWAAKIEVAPIAGVVGNDALGAAIAQEVDENHALGAPNAEEVDANVGACVTEVDAKFAEHFTEDPPSPAPVTSIDLSGYELDDNKSILRAHAGTGKGG